MKQAQLFGLFASFSFTTIVSFAAAPSPAATPISKDDLLLEQGFNLSQKLGGKEHVPYLIELCTISANLNPPAEKTRDYSLALFRLASTEQDRELHVVGQKNAVTCLSYVDPEAAMDLLSKVNFQRPSRGEILREDPRYNAAEKAFANLLARSKSPQRVDSVIAKARYLGQTGQYPYFGVSKVIGALPASSKAQVNTLLRDAIAFYATETGFYNRDQEFLRLLQSLKNPAIDRDLVARAFSTFAQRLKQDPIEFPGDYYAEVHSISNGKVFPFTNRNAAFLFQAYPQIRRLNPTLAAQLRQQDPKLNDGTDDMLYISGGFVQGDPTSEQAARQHLQWLQESLLNRINECQDSNPQAAAALAQRLTDLSSRIVGFSAAIAGIARSNSSTARSMFQEQLSALGNLGNSIGKLRATVALTLAAYHIGDSDEYGTLGEQALETGIHFFLADAQADRTQNRKGFAELQDLVTFTASQPTDILQGRVQQLPDDWLKGYLWLYEVKGHGRRNSPPPPPRPCPE